VAHDRGFGRLLGVSTLTLAVALTIGACGGAPASVAPSFTATPSATATPAPTPSPTPIDVAAMFVKIISSPDFTAAATIKGRLKIGTVDGDLTGVVTGGAGDSSQSLTITAGSFTQVTSSTKIGDTSWSRKSPGPWLEDLKTSTPKKDLSDFLRGLSAVVDLGVETRGGKSLHHLQASGGNEIAGETLGFDVATAKDAKFTIDFYATDDGTPAIIAITGAWTTVSGDTEVPTTVTYELSFSDVGTAQTVTPPEGVWVRYTSKTHHYTMAHPADWTVESEKGKDSYLLNGQGYVYVAVTPYTGSTAKFVTALKASYKAPFGGDPASEAKWTLGGQPAVRLIYRYTNDTGQDVTIADDITTRDGAGWEVFIATGGGTEDISVFDQFVATFEFTP
jgi:hypothetical protein